ncbi:ribonuclease HII [candidate division KSB1 bacterium]|nr:ribonuclease HII [candidate division KSB1 bacterium]
MRLAADTLAFERDLWRQGFKCLAGVDEAGRGPLAGPVVAAAVVFRPNQKQLPGIDDSKRLSPQMRDKAFKLIHKKAWSVGIGAASEEEIDALNIRRASLLAMQRAVEALTLPAEYCLCDGREMPAFGMNGLPLIKGDQRSMSIAAASIIAKVTRDRIMIEYDALYPQYGFARHKGYPTLQHLIAIRTHGFCPIHRRSFHPKFLYDQPGDQL